MRLASEITRSPTFPPSVGMTRFFSNLLVAQDPGRIQGIFHQHRTLQWFNGAVLAPGTLSACWAHG